MFSFEVPLLSVDIPRPHAKIALSVSNFDERSPSAKNEIIPFSVGNLIPNDLAEGVEMGMIEALIDLGHLFPLGILTIAAESLVPTKVSEMSGKLIKVLGRDVVFVKSSSGHSFLATIMD